LQSLGKIDSFDFDIFELRDSTEGNELVVSISHLLEKEGLIESLGLKNELLRRFLKKIQEGYSKDILYHNATHAADLSCTAYFYCKTGGFK